MGVEEIEGIWEMREAWACQVSVLVQVPCLTACAAEGIAIVAIQQLELSEDSEHSPRAATL